MPLARMGVGRLEPHQSCAPGSDSPVPGSSSRSSRPAYHILRGRTRAVRVENSLRDIHPVVITSDTGAPSVALNTSTLAHQVHRGCRPPHQLSVGLRRIGTRVAEQLPARHANFIYAKPDASAEMTFDAYPTAGPLQ